jgi:glycosyltransferase involved in cell wall biosynthesis
MELILVRETWSHMGSSSGFDPLFTEIEKIFENQSVSLYANAYEHASLPKWPLRVFQKKNRISVAGRFSPFIEAKHERLAQVVVRTMQQRPNTIVFLSVTENQFAPSIAALPDSYLKRLVLFVHQPPAWFKLNWVHLSIFSKVKAIVCLSVHQTQFFQSVSGSTPVIHINHGVDLNFFKPTDLLKPFEGRFLFVGQWMRDLNVLTSSFKLMLAQHPDISLHCVIQRRFRNQPSLYQLAQLKEVYWYNDVSSEQLLELYQSADALFLPLIDSTANNALNEAMACGLPIISTRVGGVSDYVLAQASLLAEPGNASSHAQAGFDFIQNNTFYKNMKADIRLFAEVNLSWRKQAKYLIDHLIN